MKKKPIVMGQFITIRDKETNALALYVPWLKIDTIILKHGFINLNKA